MDIKSFIQEYKDGTLTITSGVSYNVRDVIEKSIRLKHSKFNEDTFPDGSKKLFYNIGWVMADTLYRNTDIDTKDLHLKSTNGKNIDIVSYLRLAFRDWLRRSAMSSQLNDIRRELIDMGQVLVKKVGDGIEIVNLLNVIIPPDADTVQDSGLVEKVYLTWDEIKKYEDKWDNWDEVLKVRDKMLKQGETTFTVYEHWLEDEFDGKFQKGCRKYLDKEVLSPRDSKTPDTWSPYLQVDEFKTPEEIEIREGTHKGEKVPIYPYIDQSLFKVRGRYIGFGVYELIAGVIEDYNEKMNLKRRFDRLALRGIMLHKQPSNVEKQRTLTQQFIDNIEVGTVIDIEQDEDLVRLNLGSYTADVIASVDKLFELARQIVGITAQGTGERLPSETPATIGVINQQIAQTTYDIVNEQQGILLKYLFEDFLLPTIVKEITRDDWFEITGDENELMELEDKFIRNKAYSFLQSDEGRAFAMAGVEKAIDAGLDYTKANEMVSEQLVEAMSSEIRKNGKVRYIDLRDNLVKNLKYYVEFYVTNESFDKQVQVENILNLLSNPYYTGSRKRLEQELLDILGFTGRRYEKTDEEIQQEQMLAQAQQSQQAKPKGSVGQAQKFTESNNVVPKNKTRQ